MNKHNIHKYWHLLEAVKAGKVVQFYRDHETGWVDVTEGHDGNISYPFAPERYRVKPEPVVEPVVEEYWVSVTAKGYTGVRCKSRDLAEANLAPGRTGFLYTRIEDGVMVEQKLIPAGAYIQVTNVEKVD